MQPATFRLSFRAVALCLAISWICVAGVASADEVTLTPVADAALYEQPAGLLANGAGDYLFVGNTAVPDVRRSLLRFDLAAIPPGSTIDSVELTLNVSRTIAGTEDVNVHRVTTDWNEGPSIAPGEEGGGATSMAGDATWIHKNYDTTFWTTPGGDFVAAPSATAAVAGLGPYTWGSTAGLVADVQAWVDSPATNFGWMLVGNEAVGTTAKRFDSRENPGAGVQPELRVVFTPTAALADVPTLDPRMLAVLAVLLMLVGARLVSSRQV